MNMSKLRTGYSYHEIFGWHDTGTNAGFFPSDPALGLQPFQNYENAETKRRIHELIVVSKLIDELKRINVREATTEELLLVHPQSYLTQLKKTSEQLLGGDAGDGETPFAKGGYEIAAMAVGSVIEMAQSIMKGEVDNGYALVRPPGHHAIKSGGMGYCLFSNLGIALSVIKRDNPGIKIATVDWDVHHGNGTEDIFWDDPNVLTISLHQDRLYPRNSGMRDKRGGSAAPHSNINIPKNVTHVIYAAQSNFSKDFPCKASDLININFLHPVSLAKKCAEMGISFTYVSTGSVYKIKENFQPHFEVDALYNENLSPETVISGFITWNIITL